MTENDSNDGNAEMDNLLAELEKDAVPEESELNNKIKNKIEKKQDELNYEDSIDDETKRTDENTW